MPWGLRPLALPSGTRRSAAEVFSAHEPARCAGLCHGIQPGLLDRSRVHRLAARDLHLLEYGLYALCLPGSIRLLSASPAAQRNRATRPHARLPALHCTGHGIAAAFVWIYGGYN